MLTLPRNIAVRRAPAPRRSLLVLLAAGVAIFTGPGASRASAATATSTTLTVTSGGSAITTVTSGSKVTLTATVTANGTALTTGLVNFCDAAATYCTDIHILGSAQLTSAGTATVNLRPANGSHSYNAVFAGTTSYAKSTSSTSSLSVAGTLSSATSLAVTGSSGNYTLTATVAGAATTPSSPTGTVSFLDVSNGNKLLGTSALTAGAVTLTSGGTVPAASIVASGDFNADGRTDLISLTTTSNPSGTSSTTLLTILLSNGNGSFVAVPSFTLSSSSAGGFAVGDFNADGKLDFVAAGDAYTVFLGNGDGTFAPQPEIKLPNPVTYYSGGNGTGSIAVADFNSDGKADLMLAGLDALELLGNGDGSFASPIVVATPREYTVVGAPYLYGYQNATVADFNGDGNFDVYFSGQHNYLDQANGFLFFGKGDGTFTQSSTYPDPTDVRISGGLVAADFDGDGLADLVLQKSCSQLAVYYGATSNPLTRSTPVSLGSSSNCLDAGIIRAGDLNQDGSVDLLWAQPTATSVSGPISYIASVVLGPVAVNQSPNYTLPSTTGAQVLGLLIADFNGDGYPDALATQRNNDLSTSTLLLTDQITNASASLSSFSLSTPGTHLVQASYGGDSSFGSSLSNTVSLTQSSADSLVLSASPSSGSVYGQQVVLTAGLSPYIVQGQSTDGESIKFTANGILLGTGALSSGVATLNVTSLSGTNALQASYAGDPNLAPLTSNTLSYLVQGTPVVTWNPPATTSVYTGKAIGSALLNATSTTPGTITYTAISSAGASTPLTAASVLSAGAYTLTALLVPTDQKSYSNGTASITYTVTPASLTVVPQNASRLYGTANPALSGTVTGALNTDTFTVTGSTTATVTSPVGSYPITYTVTGNNIANYTVVSATGTLTITQAGITLSWAAPGAITYGTALSSGQLNATASVPGTFTYSPAVGTVLAAGTQTLSVSFVPTDTTDYTTPAAKTVSILINKAALALTATSTARVYGAANPAFTGTITGAVNNDALTEAFSTTATPSSIVGSYPIVPSVTGTNLANYTVTPINGVLTISQAGTATTFALSNSNTTLTATVLSLTSGSPTGSVGFYENQALVGTGTLTNGTATYTTSSAPPANAVISAQYSGDVNFTQSASQPILLLSMQPASSSLTVSGAGSVSDAITLSAIPGFTGALQLSCNGLPQGATCSFSPASVTFPGTSNTANSTMTIHTGGTSSNTLKPLFPSSFERNAALAAMFWVPGIFLPAFARRKRKNLRALPSLLLLLLFSGAVVSLTACGAAAPATGKTVSGTSLLSVIATGANGFSQSTAVTLTVQ